MLNDMAQNSLIDKILKENPYLATTWTPAFSSPTPCCQITALRSVSTGTESIADVSEPTGSFTRLKSVLSATDSSPIATSHPI
jgi:hypothetical protein